MIRCSRCESTYDTPTPAARTLIRTTRYCARRVCSSSRSDSMSSVPMNLSLEHNRRAQPEPPGLPIDGRAVRCDRADGRIRSPGHRVGVAIVASQHPAAPDPDLGADDVRVRPKGAENLRGGFGVVEGHGRRAVDAGHVGDHADSPDLVPVLGKGVEGDQHDAGQHQRGGRGDDPDGRQLPRERQILEPPPSAEHRIHP